MIIQQIPLGFEIINLGGGKEPITINRFISYIEEITGKKAIIEHRPSNSADMDYTMADIKKAKRVLNWQPTTGVREGLEQMLIDRTQFIYDEG